MLIWRIYQSIVHDPDSWDSAIVIAPDEESARRIHPGGYVWDEEKEVWLHDWKSREPVEYDTGWANPKDVKTELIGITIGRKEDEVILSSSPRFV